MVVTYTKDYIISELRRVKQLGWVQNRRHGNAGGVGNTLEDLLGIDENNLAIANAGEWELKSQRKDTSSLITLFHCEPSPRKVGFVSQVLLPLYGWKHAEAGKSYKQEEMSFRQTIHASESSDRGFRVVIDKIEQKISVTFTYNEVSDRHNEWLSEVINRIGLFDLNPQPYWGFKDLEHKAGTKLLNCFYVIAERKREDGVEYFHYNDIKMLRNFSFEKFILAVENDQVLIDFDARTGHNHGTKFRIKQSAIASLYEDVVTI